MKWSVTPSHSEPLATTAAVRPLRRFLPTHRKGRTACESGRDVCERAAVPFVEGDVSQKKFSRNTNFGVALQFCHPVVQRRCVLTPHSPPRASSRNTSLSRTCSQLSHSCLHSRLASAKDHIAGQSPRSRRWVRTRHHARRRTCAKRLYLSHRVRMSDAALWRKMRSHRSSGSAFHPILLPARACWCVSLIFFKRAGRADRSPPSPAAATGGGWSAA